MPSLVSFKKRIYEYFRDLKYDDDKWANKIKFRNQTVLIFKDSKKLVDIHHKQQRNMVESSSIF